MRNCRWDLEILVSKVPVTNNGTVNGAHYYPASSGHHRNNRDREISKTYGPRLGKFKVLWRRQTCMQRAVATCSGVTGALDSAWVS